MKIKIKLIILFAVIIFTAGFIEFQRLGYLNPNVLKYVNNSSEVVMNAEPVYARNVPDNIKKDSTLIIYDSTDEKLTENAKRFKENLDYLKEDSKMIKISELRTVNFDDYTNIIVSISNLESDIKKSQVERIIKFAENGGGVFFTVAFTEHSSPYNSIYKKLGIESVNGYQEINGIKFVRELMPSINGKKFVSDESFDDSCVKVTLSSDSEVYMESAGKVEGEPLLWKTPLGKGTVVVYNGTGMGAPFYGGVFAGAYSLLHTDYIYPIINAKVIYIDDFPAPQYDIDYSKVTETYNRTMIEFYRDIWWPDMQGVAKKYDYKYTGLFISTYNNEVDPSKFIYENFEYFQYYGNSLIKNNYEIGLHGYNHQSLALKGFVPKDVGYNPWKSQSDMEASLTFLEDYAKKLFPGVTYTSYVPPSNYLSPEGRKAVANALPNLKIISGVYYDDTAEKKSYVQKFEIADDGIAEFPRLTSGMWMDDSVRFEYLNGLALHGVFSHFIHPDDIIDEERGRGALWDTLIDNFSKLLKDVNKEFPEIRALKSTDAADALKVYDKLEVQLDYSNDKIDGYCENFYGEAYFYLRTDKTPSGDENSVTLTKAGDAGYYLVKVTEPNFTIKLN